MSEETKTLTGETPAPEAPADEETALTAAETPDAPETEEETEAEIEEDGDEEYEYEEETPEEVVYATTEIDGELLDLLSRVLAQGMTQKSRMTLLIGAIAALAGGLVLAFVGQSVWGMLCAIISLMLFRQLHASSEKVTRKSLEKYNGLRWDYTVDKQGVHVGKSVNDRYNPWNLMKRGWLEGDYYLMEVPGSLPIAIRRSSLSSAEQNLLELLMLENLKSCTF